MRCRIQSEFSLLLVGKCTHHTFPEKITWLSGRGIDYIIGVLTLFLFCSRSFSLDNLAIFDFSFSVSPANHVFCSLTMRCSSFSFSRIPRLFRRPNRDGGRKEQIKKQYSNLYRKSSMYHHFELIISSSRIVNRL